MYGKITNGEFEAAPRTLTEGTCIIINPTPDKYAAAGYKPVRITEGYGSAVYTETATEIIQSWDNSPPVNESDPITDLELAVCEIYEMLEALTDG